MFESPVLGTLPGEDEEEGPVHPESLCTLLLKDFTHDL